VEVLSMEADCLEGFGGIVQESEGSRSRGNGGNPKVVL